MKILIVSDSLSKGGKERQIAELLNYFSAHTHITFRIVVKDIPQAFSFSQLKGIQMAAPQNRLSLFKFFFFLKRNIADFKPDIVHTWEGGVGLCTSFIKIARMGRLTIIDGALRYSKSFPVTSKIYWINRFNFTFANAVVSNSKAGLKALPYKKNSKFQVIPNGFDFQRFEKYKKIFSTSGETVNIGMIGNFTAPKDYRSLIMASIEMIRSKLAIHTFCIGDGPELEKIKRLVPHEFKNYFTFTGNLDEPETILCKLDIGVLLNKQNHSEGMSNAIMEYMVVGLPVVCTNTGGNPELVNDGLNGFLTHHEHVKEIVDKLTLLVQNTELRIKMGEKSKLIAHERFGIEKVGNRYIELYKSLIKN